MMNSVATPLLITRGRRGRASEGRRLQLRSANRAAYRDQQRRPPPSRPRRHGRISGVIQRLVLLHCRSFAIRDVSECVSGTTGFHMVSCRQLVSLSPRSTIHGTQAHLGEEISPPDKLRMSSHIPAPALFQDRAAECEGGTHHSKDASPFEGLCAEFHVPVLALVPDRLGERETGTYRCKSCVRHLV